LAFSCSSDKGETDIAGTLRELSDAQFASMVEVLNALSATLTTALNAVTTPGTISGGLPCADGGSMNYSGQRSEHVSDGTSTLDLSVTVTHVGCRARAGDGEVWTFSGDPSISASLRYVIGGQSGSATGSERGGFRWAGVGRSGTCTIDVTYSQSVELVDGVQVSTYSATGVICGEAINENRTF
jgi:hypothetical protein